MNSILIIIVVTIIAAVSSTAVPNYNFTHYNMDHNVNCRASTFLTYWGGRNADRTTDPNGTCCKFQEQVTQSPQIDDVNGLNEFSVMLGQTLWSHDTALTNTNSNNPYELVCGNSFISLSGMEQNENTNEIRNAITSCLDGSMMYGRNQATLEALSTEFPRMDMNNNDEPPSPDTCQVNMANPLHFDPSTLYSLGDVRGNENPGLTAIHVMWLRRHNQWVDTFEREHSNWTKQQMFERARAIVIAEIQKVAMEYAEALLGKRLPYQRQKQQNGQEVKLFAEFSHGINRLQHAQLRNDILIQGPNVNITATLLEVYFNTHWIKTYGTDPILNGMLQRKSLNMGMHYVEELLGNFERGGPNLAVADCGRGREAGFQSYKHIREALFPN